MGFDVAALADGTIIVANFYDEGHRYYGVYKSGVVKGQLPCASNDNIHGGYAIASNGTYLYTAYENDSGPVNGVQ